MILIGVQFILKGNFSVTFKNYYNHKSLFFLSLIFFVYLFSGNLRLTELSREREDDGTRAYEAIVLIGWDAEHERYACLWLDSTGGGGLVNGIIGYAAPDGDRLAFRFDLGDESLFHTTFTSVRERDVWELHMDSERGGEFRPFARATMTRRD
jgi:hypothetical protein